MKSIIGEESDEWVVPVFSLILFEASAMSSSRSLFSSSFLNCRYCITPISEVTLKITKTPTSINDDTRQNNARILKTICNGDEKLKLELKFTKIS